LPRKLRSGGRAGVEIARPHPDRVVSAIMIPEKDSYRVLLELRTQPATALIPFIFLTAKQEKPIGGRVWHWGADDYLGYGAQASENLASTVTIHT
jgi:response regulator RpfG family c-di-GMP phosphodiesterase